VQCLLVYEDPDLTPAAARAHAASIDMPRFRPSSTVTGRSPRAPARTITPEAAVVDRTGAVRYRGRVDNKYVALGRARRTVTEHDLTNALDALTAGKPVAAATTQPVGCVIVPAICGET
jgi:hypothetical protein